MGACAGGKRNKAACDQLPKELPLEKSEPFIFNFSDSTKHLSPMNEEKRKRKTQEQSSCEGIGMREKAFNIKRSDPKANEKLVGLKLQQYQNELEAAELAKERKKEVPNLQKIQWIFPAQNREGSVKQTSFSFISQTRPEDWKTSQSSIEQDNFNADDTVKYRVEFPQSMRKIQQLSKF